MENLKNKVNELENEHNKVKQIRILQRINELLLTKYIIKVNDNFIIEPLRVEAYYYDENKFIDCNVHRFAKQKGENRFGKLYIHRGWSGVDICLSCGDYYLSFLIKNSRYKNESLKQIVLSSKLKMLNLDIDELEETMVLIPKPSNNKEVFHTVRKGLVKNDFRNARLASLIELENKNHKYDFQSGYARGRIVVEQIKSDNPFDYKGYIDISKSEIEKIMRKINLCDTCVHYPDYPYCSDDVEFGDGVGNDNVYKCGKYESTEGKQNEK